MRRLLFKVLITLLILLVLVVGAGAWLLNDETFLKNQVAKYALEFTGRELAVDGNLDLQLGLETTLDARNIRFENAEWAETPDLLRVGHLRVTVNVPSLFEGLPYIPSILLEDCSIDLETSVEGYKNWDVLPEKDEPEAVALKSPGPVKVLNDELLINNCRFTQNSPEHETPLDILLESASLKRIVGDRIEADVSGSINEDTLEVDGWLAPASAFHQGGALDFELALRAGVDRLELSGGFTDLDTLAQPDFKGHYHGPEITNVLRRFGLPPVAEGPFDVRARLETDQDQVKVEVYGDIGTLDLTASGELDKLLEPNKGFVKTWAAGPNLGALAKVLGVPGLVEEPFDWRGDFNFYDGTVDIEDLRLGTERDEVKLSGRLSTSEGMPDSELELNLKTEEISRWAHLVDKSWQPQGALEVRAQALTDAAGILSIDTLTLHRESELQASGEIGLLAGPYKPDLQFSFRSSDMPRLVGLFSEISFPGGDFKVNGHVRLNEHEVSIDNLETFLEGHRISVGGRVMLEKNFAGSDVDIHMEIPDLAAFGQLFGRENLPSEPVLINGSLKPVGEGLAIQIKNSEVGDIQLSLDAEIPNLDEPAGIDADFNIRFPDEKILNLLVPKLGFPAGVLTVSGGLVNEEDRTVAQKILLTLGENRLNVDGHIGRDSLFDFDVRTSGPDAGELKSLIGTYPGEVPYAISAQVRGSPSEFTISKLSAKVGESVAAGELTIGLSEITRVTGKIKSPYLNISTWTAKDAEEEPATEASDPTGKRWVFDDTPMMLITDLGVEIDIDLQADTLDLGDSRINDLAINFLLQDNLIQAKPFTFRDMRGAQLSGGLTLESQGATPKLQVNLLATDFHPLIGAKEGQDPSTLPSGDFLIDLQSFGQNRREMASNMDGRIRLKLGPGKLAPSAYGFLMTDFLGQLVDNLNPYSEVKEYTSLECAVASADIESGLATISPIIFHTEQLTIVSEGTIDLNTEKLDISFNSKQRKGLGISATDLVNPFIKVGGTMAAPSLILDPKSTVVKGSIAVATFGVSILANSLADRFLSSKDPCGDAVKTVEKRDKKKS